MHGLMNKSFTFQRKSRTPDGQGGFDPTWPDTVTRKGRLRPLKATEKLAAGRFKIDADYILYVTGTPDIKPHDRTPWDGDFLYVKEVRNPSHINHHLEIYLGEK